MTCFLHVSFNIMRWTYHFPKVWYIDSHTKAIVATTTVKPVIIASFINGSVQPINMSTKRLGISGAPAGNAKVLPNFVLKGALAHGVSIFPKYFCLLHCVPLYVYRLCINFQDLCARLLGMAALRILLLTFTSRFVIDFLSIRKVIIFSAIATDDRHPLRSRSIHQNAANCMTIHFRYIAQPRGIRKTYCARSRNMFDALPVGRTAC